MEPAFLCVQSYMRPEEQEAMALGLDELPVGETWWLGHRGSTKRRGILGYGSWEASLITVVSSTGSAGYLLLLRFVYYWV